MARIVNVGSINIDHVYRVDRFVRPGETLQCRSYDRTAGGKGLNQSIALAHAGASVLHAGRFGRGDEWLVELLARHGVDTTYVSSVNGPSGHAVIQVDSEGENAIVIHGGANHLVTAAGVAGAIAACGPDDFLLLQNEIRSVPEIMEAAKGYGLDVAFNPAPMTDPPRRVTDFPLELVDILILNEGEARVLTGGEGLDDILSRVLEAYPGIKLVVTRGENGAVYADAERRVDQPAKRVDVVDTTAAGDTFIGYFLAEWVRTGNPEAALAVATKAAAICVTRHGAADSIPFAVELGAVH